MGILSVGSKSIGGVAAGLGVGYAGYKATQAGYTAPGMTVMGAGAAIGTASMLRGKVNMNKALNDRALNRIARESAKVANRDIRRGSVLRGAAKLSAGIGVAGGMYGAYNQEMQGDIGGAAMGYGVAAVGLGLGAKAGLASRRFTRSGVNLTSAVGTIERGLARGGRLSPERAASVGKSISRATPRSSGRSISELPMGSTVGSGAMVNPAGARQLTSSYGRMPRETRGQRVGNEVIRALRSGLSGGFL